MRVEIRSECWSNNHIYQVQEEKELGMETNNTEMHNTDPMSIVLYELL